jgi:hypothetical protein
MKKAISIISILAALSLTACNTVTLPTVSSEESICTNRPEVFVNSESHICATSLALGTTPENLDAYLLDATAMAYITKMTDKKKIARFLDRSEKQLRPMCMNITYDDILTKLDQESERSALLKRVINRKMRFYAGIEPVSDFDCWMMLEGINHQREQFGLSFHAVE